MDRGAWWATVHGIPKESNTTKLISTQGMVHRSETGFRGSDKGTGEDIYCVLRGCSWGGGGWKRLT